VLSFIFGGEVLPPKLPLSVKIWAGKRKLASGAFWDGEKEG